jgi:hypothetical protein
MSPLSCQSACSRLLRASKIWSGVNARTWSWTAVRGVVADRASHDARAAWDELSEDRVQAFVGLVACPVGVRHQPLDSSGERWRNDEDLFGRFDHGSNVVGQLVQVGYRCAGEHQQAIDV